MAKIRVYELAKELGVDNKVVIDKAHELGIVSVKSHSNSLDPDEVDNLRREFIRAAIGPRPDSEVVKTEVDSSTGEKSTIVERRKGDVVRRRRSDSAPERVAAPQAATPLIEPAVVETYEQESEIQPQQLAAVAAAEELFKQEEVSVVSVVASELVTTEVAVTEAPEAEKIGPKVLGRMELPSKKVKPKRAVEGVVFSAKPKLVVDDEEEGKPKAKRGRKREFGVGDLVDYEGNAARRQKTKGKKGRKGQDDSLEPKQEVTQTRASKRVVRMPANVITVGELASQMSVKVGDVIGKLIGLGVMATINQAIDQDTASIVADDFGFTLEFTGFDEALMLDIEGINDESQMQPRPPVVTVMGHVDHGKTSLLDKIRATSIAAKEHGGITQHIGAYQVKLENDRVISFLDTPGHAAFTQMRARGAKVTDIVILVVAVDDGMMPQTVEAINHARAAEVPIVVAINKVDKPGTNPERIKQQLSDHGLIPEDWGGDTMYFPVSAITGQGVQELLEGVLLVAEVKELKANPVCRVKGVIIEARQEKGRGTVATVLVQAGTLKVGDIFICGAESGRVRSMVDHTGATVLEAPPSMPVEISGLNGVPIAGDDFVVMTNEAQARELAQSRTEILRQKDALALAGGPVSLEEFAKMAEQQETFDLRLVIKADVQGSLEAISDSVTKLSTDRVKVKVVHGAVGGVNESDVQLAIASKALIVGFGVRGEPRALAEAEGKSIEVRFYRVIYELMDDVKQAMAGLLPPVRKEVHLGRAEVRDTFSVPKIGVVAGCYITDGMVKRGAQLRLVRDSRVIFEGRMLNLRRFKDDVKEVQTGYECGISFDGYNDIKAGDVIEAFEIKEEAAVL